MARIQEEVIVVKLSKLVRDNETDQNVIVTREMLENIEESVQHLVSDVVLVETERKE
jgi:hypothetical protein